MSGEHTHTVTVEDGLRIVTCTDCGFVTPFSLGAPAEELCCLHCEGLLPPDEWEPCCPTDEELPPIGGGAHGKPHRYDEWAPCKVPLRVIVAFDCRFATHEGMIPMIRRVEARWRARGGQSFYRIHTVYSYACRPTRSGGSTSAHSWAIALDINPPENPYTKSRRPDGSCPTNMPGEFVGWWRAEGFGWGGAWRSVCDSMHMTKLPREGGDGLLYVGSAPAAAAVPDEQEVEMFTVRDKSTGRVYVISGGFRKYLVNGAMWDVFKAAGVEHRGDFDPTHPIIANTLDQDAFWGNVKLVALWLVPTLASFRDKLFPEWGDHLDAILAAVNKDAEPCAGSTAKEIVDELRSRLES